MKFKKAVASPKGLDAAKLMLAPMLPNTAQSTFPYLGAPFHLEHGSQNFTLPALQARLMPITSSHQFPGFLPLHASMVSSINEKA